MSINPINEFFLPNNNEYTAANAEADRQHDDDDLSTVVSDMSLWSATDIDDLAIALSGIAIENPHQLVAARIWFETQQSRINQVQPPAPPVVDPHFFTNWGNRILGYLALANPPQSMHNQEILTQFHRWAVGEPAFPLPITGSVRSISDVTAIYHLLQTPEVLQTVMTELHRRMGMVTSSSPIGNATDVRLYSKTDQKISFSTIGYPQATITVQVSDVGGKMSSRVSPKGHRNNQRTDDPLTKFVLRLHVLVMSFTVLEQLYTPDAPALTTVQRHHVIGIMMRSLKSKEFYDSVGIDENERPVVSHSTHDKTNFYGLHITTCGDNTGRSKCDCIRWYVCPHCKIKLEFACPHGPDLCNSYKEAICSVCAA